MAFNTIVQGLNDVHFKSANTSFFVSQVQTRALNVVNFLREAWQIILDLGEVLKGSLGVAVKTLIWVPRKLVHIDFLERLNSALSGCPEVYRAASEVIQLTLGALSTAVLGVVVNPNWNHKVHQVLSIVPSTVRPVVTA